MNAFDGPGGVALNRPVFVFSGHGGQWARMGLELWDAFPAFAAGMEECADALRRYVDWSLEDVLRGVPGAPALERVDVVQPALFAVMVSLARLWRSFEVEPAAVVGHSQGEIAAAHVAGGLSMDDAARIVALRSRALAVISGQGGMVAVGASLERVTEYLERFPGRLWPATINGPSSIGVSGEPSALDDLVALCEADRVRAGRVRIDYAAHSPQIEVLRDRLLEALASVAPQPGEVPLISTLTGEQLDTARMDAEYWYRSERETVQFGPAIEGLVRRGSRTFIEIGPHPVLTVPIEAVAEALLGGPGEVVAVASLRRNQGGPARFMSSLAELYVRCEPERTPAMRSPFAARVAAITPSERVAAVLDAVLGEMAMVLGQRSAADIDSRLTFKELGFDSPAIVELRNRVNKLTGLRLVSTALFDVPTPVSLAERVVAELTGATGEAQVVRSPSRVDEPVAIVGMACRYPGGVRSAEDLWDLVESGGDAIGEFPTDRGWDLGRLIDPDGGRLGSSYVARGGFLYDAAEFDAELFGISPREALAMDPQQRLLLECSWEALEDAAIDPLSLRGSDTGVFAGLMSQDYGPAMHEPDENSAGYALTGTEASVASGRVSYVLGLEGPAVSVDTACSSSLVALHLACQALRAGECSMALAGGATIMSTPGIFVEFSRQRGLSPDGRCRAFAAGANGTGWSEGAGILVLERLSDAVRHGHRVLAVVRGGAVNQDGASNGLTAPSGRSQERVIRQALAVSGLEPGDVDAVEAHGTGTTLGDPIEAQALLATYGQGRSNGPLYLGSLKSNIGHSQAAAGVGGVIKMVQALRHERLPATLWADEPTLHVDWGAGAVRLLSEAVAWPAGERVRRAGVSSFGVSGTNAHVVLEEAPVADRAEGERGGLSQVSSRVLPFLVSGSSSAALVAQAGRLREFVAERPELDPVEVAGSLAYGRARLAHRAVAVVGGLGELADCLAGVERGEFVDGLVQGVARRDRRVAFVFPGQGGQWPGMALELWDSSPVFAASMQECAAALDRYVDWSLEDVLRGVPGAPTLERVEVVQPALFSIMVSLAALWRSYGVEPSAVVGHSQGEIAAAHIAGALSLDDAARVVAARSLVLRDTLSGLGGMVSVGTSPDRVQQYLEPLSGRASLAAVNGPTAVIVSGEPAALDDLIAACEADDVRAKRLSVDYAAHSAQIDTLRERLLGEFGLLAPRTGEIPLYSTVMAGLVDTSTMDAEYWFRNLRQTVRFEPAVRAMLEDGVGALIETGPHPVLAQSLVEIGEAVGGEAPAVIGSLRRADGGLERFIRSVAEAHTAGIEVDWSALFGARAGGRVSLPSYAFQHRSYWLSPGSGSRDPSALGQVSAGHPLLGAMVSVAGGGESVFTGRVSLVEQAWLADHVVMGVVVVPASVFVELALHAAAGTDAPVVEELTLAEPLVLEEGGAVAVQVTVSGADEGGRRRVAIYSRPERDDDAADWTEHAAGSLVGVGYRDDVPGVWPAEGEEIDPELVYARLAEAGYELGPAFGGVQRVLRAGDVLDVEVALGEQSAGVDGFGVSPALLEAGLFAGVLAGGEGGPVEVPFSFSGVRLVRSGAVALRVRLVVGEGSWSVVGVDGDGAVVVVIDEVRTRRLDVGGLGSREGRRDALFCVEWSQLPGAAQPSQGLRLAVLGGGVVVGESGGVTVERYENLEALSDAVALGAQPPEHVVVGVESPAGEGVLESAHALTGWVLELVKGWLAVDVLADSKLTLLTCGAVAAVSGERPDLRQAPLAGLLRSAQAEHPGRLGLIDRDAGELSSARLAAGLVSGEPELALRDGLLLVPRLRRFRGDLTRAPDERRGTVLITGGTTGLGALLARSLVERDGVRSLLLISRRGALAPGADQLVADLGGLGCAVQIVACDATDRDALERVLTTIPPEQPLTTVIHAAAVMDNGMIDALDGERLRRVMRPKLDAAIHLHELTRDLDLSEFILFSSGGAALGSPGASNYAAANTFLDALAAARHADGLPALALAFGSWERATELTQHLKTADGRRAGQLDTLPMSDELGLDLIHTARQTREPMLLPMRLDLAALRARAAAGLLPGVFSELVPAGAARSATARRSLATAGSSLATAVAGAAEAERDRVVVDFVRSHLAAVLGQGSPESIEADRPFKELGIDSLSAVELRNRLVTAGGLALPTTLVFDHPTPTAVAALLRGMVEGRERESNGRPRRQTRVDEPVAIVGMACRYPGGVRSAEDLWDLVESGGDAIGEFPTDRGWDLGRLIDPDGGRLGSSYVARGGFLYDAAEFDAELFGISPREALAMDPQQRLLLECSWEALEDAAIDPLSLRGSDTGVFAGTFDSGYGFADATAELEGFRVTGGITSAISGRVSYVLGLEGPAVSVDTACSSSLVALHLACQALRAGECSMALSGGVTILVTPQNFVEFSRQRGLSPDGRCRAFGAGADGTGFSDGVGVLVLERLSVAQQRGHRVLAVVRGGAVNQDGASNGFAAPNGPSQERVIRQALAVSGLEPGDVDAVEAHGTGTTLGDPIEAQALLATYGQGRSNGPLYLGSLKSNIGHSQAAAGVGGVIKMVQALRHERLPATLWADEPTLHVDWGAGAVRLLSEAVAWPAGERVRRAGVSSFGVSGTNAHVVLEEAPVADRAEGERGGLSQVSSRVLPFLVSGSSSAALVAQAGRLREFVAERPELDPVEVAGSLAYGRARLAHRAVAVVGGLGELPDCLAGVERGEFVDGLVQGVARRDRRVAFVFPGQGGQWPGMALELWDSSPVFAASMRDCSDVLVELTDFSLEAVLRGDQAQPSLELIEVVQPALFSIMVSLAALWRSYGVEPSAVVGHSQGEIAAAHLVGALSLEDAARVVVVRSQALASIAGQGGMMSVALSPEELAERAGGLDQRLGIAAINGPSALVVSGELDALQTLEHSCEADGIPARRVASTVAGHSPQIEPLREQMLSALATVTPRRGEIPLYSTVMAGLVDTSTMDAEYWFRNLRQTVRFEPAVRAMLEDGVGALIETGPHPVLAQSLVEIGEAVGGEAPAVIGSLRRADGGLERFIRSVAEAHTAGIEVDWSALFGARAGGRVSLPSYAFQHRSYWLSPGSGSRDPSALGQVSAGHPLLGAMVSVAGGGESVFTGRVSLVEQAWLADHVVMGVVVVPASVFVELALHAAAGTDAPVVEELTLAEPLVLEEGGAVAVQVTVSGADEGGRRRVAIYSRPERDDDAADWTEHAAGSLVGVGYRDDVPGVWPAEGEEIDPELVYARLAEAGYELGPAFGGVQRVLRAGDVLDVEVALGEQSAGVDGFGVSPALLEAGLFAGVLAGGEGGPVEVPFSFSGVRLVRSGAVALRVRLVVGEGSWSVVGVDGDGAVVVVIDEVRTRRLDVGGLGSREGRRDALFCVEWSQLPGAAQPSQGLRLAVLGGGVVVGESGGVTVERYENLEALSDAVALGAQPPEHVVVGVESPAGEGVLESAHALTGWVLELVKGWLAVDVLADSKLTLLTCGAVAAVSGERPDLRQAPLAGLLRSAQAEHPGRLGVIDRDAGELSGACLAAGLVSGEPELALRDGLLLVPRLRRFRGDLTRAPDERRGTVLITGGTTGLGALLARSLVERDGVRSLLLISRRGALAPGADQLAADLGGLGCAVQIVACDATDRDALERVLTTIPPEQPLTTVIHAAAALDDGMIDALDGERLRRVMSPKLDAAIHLHELTRDLDLSEFILFSSASACLGSPGQANYAAANTFLDALAAARHADGLPALALAFGFWERETELTRHLTTADGRRAGPVDTLPLPDELGLELIDIARRTHQPMLVPLRLDMARLRDRVRLGMLPPILSRLVRGRLPRAAAGGRAFASRMTDNGGADRRRVGSEEIRAEIAASLGYPSAAAIDTQLSFLELGFDSLVSVELRKRLQAITGLSLSAKMMLDHPTPAILIDYLQGLLNGSDGGAATSIAQVATNGANGGAAAGTLTQMFRRAHKLGKLKNGLALAEAAAGLRPKFGVSHTEAQAPTPIPLAKGEQDPIVFCIPSLVASSGPHEYARFAKSLQNQREVVAVPAPGFRSDELLPSTLEAVAGAQAAAIKSYAKDRSVALVGFSTGGLLAYAVARECARDGTAPTAVVLIDSYTMDTMWRIADPIFDRMLEDEASESMISDETLTAMGAYLGMLSTWTPDKPVAPTLLVKAGDPIPGVTWLGDWTATWLSRNAAVELPGSHLTILEDHAETTAGVVENWLVRHPTSRKPHERFGRFRW